MQPGSTVNQRYEILSEVGRGGMGVVYRGRSFALDRTVAIKVFTEAVSADATKRAQREAQALANVKHENLVRVYSLETDEAGHLMLVFDFIDGKPLSEILKERRLRIEEVHALFQQLCNGLGALHEHGFVHRDLKPSNLMIITKATKELHLMIIDFGLAKSIEKSQKLTATGAVLGTPEYMSPEQFAAMPVAPQADLYSAACVLYEMLTGKRPFDYESPYMVAHAQLTEAPPTISPRLDQFFIKALAKDAADRFQSASEMLAAFQACNQAESIPCLDPHRKPAARRNRIRHVATALAIWLASIACGGFLTFVLPKIQTDAESDSKVEQEAARVLEGSHRYGLNEPAVDWLTESNYFKPKVRDLEAIGAKESNSKTMIEVYCSYGDALQNAYHPTSASQQYASAWEIAKRIKDPLANNCAFRLAGSYEADAQYQKALDLYRMLATSRGGSLAILGSTHSAYAARCMYRLGLPEELVKCYGERIEREQAEQSTWFNGRRRSLAYAYMDVGRYMDAAKIVQKNHTAALPDEHQAANEAADLAATAIAYALAREHKKAQQHLLDLTKLKAVKDYVGLPEAVKALIAASAGDKKSCRQNIDKACTLSYHNSSDRQNRDALIDGIRYLKLCREAAERIQDTERGRKVDALREALEKELKQA